MYYTESSHEDTPPPEFFEEMAAKGVYLPTPEEIEIETRLIRQGWNEHQEHNRKAPERPLDLGNVHFLSGEVDDE